MSNWQEHTDADGDKFWTLEHLGHFAAVTRFGQAWEGRIWPEGDAEPWIRDFRSAPAMAMASLTLAIEASVSA